MVRAATLLPVLRVGSLLASCAGAVAGAWSLAVPALGPLLGTAAPLTLADVVAAGCAVALLGCATWLLAVTGLTVAATVGRLAAPRSTVAHALGRVSERVTPVALRTVVTAAVGVSLTLTTAGPSSADPHGRGPARPGLTGLALPDRTTGAAALSTPTRAAAPPARKPAVVTVRPGDSLWSIASGLLGAGAGDAAVTRAWHRLFDANHHRVGADPDLIRPGTRLVVPGDLAPDREERP
jgi:LysM repeat protein